MAIRYKCSLCGNPVVQKSNSLNMCGRFIDRAGLHNLFAGAKFISYNTKRPSQRNGRLTVLLQKTPCAQHHCCAHRWRRRRDSPASPLSVQWSPCVAGGAASLGFLACWASASLHPALRALGSAPLASKLALGFESFLQHEKETILYSSINSFWGSTMRSFSETTVKESYSNPVLPMVCLRSFII